MSFSPEEFVDKLQQLHDSQDSISSSAKWLLSQYRDSDAVAETWTRYVTQKKLPDRKRLLAVYLVNHVVQQGRSQGIEQFQNSFANVLIDTLPVVYSHFPPELQDKLKRVVNIWKQRKVFNPASLQQIEMNLNKAIAANPSSSTSGSKSNGSGINKRATSIPPNVQPIASLYQKLNKNKHNIPALKSRFDNAINDLDINSVVYEENFHTVTKIAKVTQDTIKESMGNRNELIKCLQVLLHEEEKSLEQDRVLLNEIEFSLESKDPTKVGNNGGNISGGVNNNDDDVLPSYGGNDSDSDSDDKDSDDSDRDEPNNDDEVTVLPKRPLDSVEPADEPVEKKLRSSNEGEEEEYIVDGGDDNELETHEANNDTTENSVTSNIQDLLSRLAN
ncbi:regulator of Ty1 transposition protein 103 [Monosporozyma unispora]